MERLQKYIANCGICSRRHAEELILHGKVKVDGQTITELGCKIEETQIVEVEGQKIHLANKKIYILLNKPIGVVTTASDEKNRPTVINLIENEIKERLFPVGRLDINTSGAIILTNDGDFAYNLTHPKNNIEKIYEVILNKNINENEIKLLESGVAIEGKKTAPCKIHQINDKKITITIHEGRNRQIRKMLENIGKKVVELKRIQIGNITLGNLPLGRFRYLSPSEVKSFK